MAVWRCKFCKTGHVCAKKPTMQQACSKRPRIKGKAQYHVWVKEKD